MSALDELSLRSSEDAYVDLFLQDAPRLGASVLLGGVPRAYVDFNRSESELDPALIAGLTHRAARNPRILSGLGVIPRVVSGARAIYSGKISQAEADQRLQRYWRPYHAKLGALLEAQRHRFGQAILFDMHSMPRDAVDYTGRFSGQRPDIVLGDRFGAACGASITEQVSALFSGAGLKVARNAPFAGAYIAQRYGMPSIRQHVLQIEISRALYLDERRVQPNQDFESFLELMRGLVKALSDIGRAAGASFALAAE